MNRYHIIAAGFIIAAIFLSGCGETINGVVKDSQRIGRGVKTVIFRDGN